VGVLLIRLPRKILWQNPDPNGSSRLGPLAVANGRGLCRVMAGGHLRIRTCWPGARDGGRTLGLCVGSLVSAGIPLWEYGVIGGRRD